MAKATDKVVCMKCQKSRNTMKCVGCAQDFCLADMNKHHKELNEQLSQTENRYNQLKNTFEEQHIKIPKQNLIKQIDDWEKESLEKVRYVANRVRRQLISRIEDSTGGLNLELRRLIEQLNQCRKEDDFVDKDVQFFDDQFKRLKTLLDTLPDCKLSFRSTSFINEIHLNGGAPLPRSAYLKPDATWIQNAITVAGGNGQGSGMNQVAHPVGVIIDDDTLYIADTWNHRILAWKLGETAGQVVAGGNGQGDRIDQLNTPTDVIIHRESDSLFISDFGNRRVVRWPRYDGLKGEIVVSNVGCWGLTLTVDGSLYIADHQKHEVRRFERGEIEGTVVAGGNGTGNRLDQLHGPKSVFVDRDHSVWVSDCSNHRVMKWKKNANEGIVVAGGRGPGNYLTQLSSPNGIVLDEMGSVYVADTGNHRIIRWNSDAKQGSVIIGKNSRKSKAYQVLDPKGLSFDCEGHLYVVDDGNSRVQRFNIERQPQQ